MLHEKAIMFFNRCDDNDFGFGSWAALCRICTTCTKSITGGFINYELKLFNGGLEATWLPGQEDKFHDHTAVRVSIFQTDCKLRITKLDETYKDVSPNAAKAKAWTGLPELRTRPKI